MEYSKKDIIRAKRINADPQYKALVIRDLAKSHWISARLGELYSQKLNLLWVKNPHEEEKIEKEKLALEKEIEAIKIRHEL